MLNIYMLCWLAQMWILLVLTEEESGSFLIGQLTIYGFIFLLENKLLVIIFRTYFDSNYSCVSKVKDDQLIMITFFWWLKIPSAFPHIFPFCKTSI